MSGCQEGEREKVEVRALVREVTWREEIHRRGDKQGSEKDVLGKEYGTGELRS